ncbi:MAG TPA: VCBS repeat-containing protein [Puia sp.]|nr:VCBS repeat-containing protein [Puia sp.]
MIKRICFIGWILLLAYCISACKHYPRNLSHAQVSTSSIREGERLAAVYCGSCHLLPDPALLNSKSWEKGVLPQMGPRLGIFNRGFERYPSNRNDANLDKGYYPAAPLLKPEEWEHILDYYTATSPDSLPGQSRLRPIEKRGPMVGATAGGSGGWPLFEVQTPGLRYDMPATSMVRIDKQGLFVFDIHYQKLYRFSPGLEVLDSLRDEGGMVDMVKRDSEWVVSNIGVLTPTNGKFGKLQVLRTVPAAGGGALAAGGPVGGIALAAGGSRLSLDSVPLAAGLERPVEVQAADLNGDGRMDYLVCEFGNLVGALSWLENKGRGEYERHVIRATPGAIKVYVNDYNHDGLPDIWALFAQGDEGIFLFTNQGKGRFSERSVLRFPPSYGSSYFELADLNKDGQPDIVYTCGDNADFSPVLKPYHGVYIFLNDGHNQFRQDYFFPIHGCYKAVAGDFDGDGDLDLATIAFFPDFNHQPEEGFVYLENIGGGDFKPYSLPQTQRGKWLTMDVGDVDGDGRLDIVLGNFSFFAPVTKAGVDFKKEAPFMVLRNVGARGR